MLPYEQEHAQQLLKFFHASNAMLIQGWCFLEGGVCFKVGCNKE